MNKLLIFTSYLLTAIFISPYMLLVFVNDFVRSVPVLETVSIVLFLVALSAFLASVLLIPLSLIVSFIMYKKYKTTRSKALWWAFLIQTTSTILFIVGRFFIENVIPHA